MLRAAPRVHLPEKIRRHAADIPHQRVLELTVTDRAPHWRARLHPVPRSKLTVHSYVMCSMRRGQESRRTRLLAIGCSRGSLAPANGPNEPTADKLAHKPSGGTIRYQRTHWCGVLARSDRPTRVRGRWGWSWANRNFSTA